jgi:hypothetical protein
VLVGSSRRKTSHCKRTTHHNNTVPRSRRTRKRPHQRNKEKQFLQPLLVDFATRLVLHDKTDSERTRHQSHHNEGESTSRGTSYNSVSLLDFPEIKWADDDENDHDDCFHFRRGGYEGPPADGIFVDHLVHQEDQSRVLQSALTLRRQRRSLQRRCLLRSKTIRRDLTDISNNSESGSTRELLHSLAVMPSKEKKSYPAAIQNETWLLETKPNTISLCYKQQHNYREDVDLTAIAVPALFQKGC